MSGFQTVSYPWTNTTHNHSFTPPPPSPPKTTKKQKKTQPNNKQKLGEREKTAKSLSLSSSSSFKEH